MTGKTAALVGLGMLVGLGGLYLYAEWPTDPPSGDSTPSASSSSLQGVSTSVGLAAAPHSTDSAAPGGSSDSAAMIGQIAALLRQRPRAVGAVRAAENEVVLLDGKVRLSVRDLREGKSAHFHVLARWSEAPAASLDACVAGLGASRGEQVKDAANSYLAMAFPPLLSLILGGQADGAREFHGTETWGVAGVRGFVGDLGSRGAKLEDGIEDAPLFADVPGIPKDGRVHLIKVVLEADQGKWLRSVELDGDRSLENRQAWGMFPAPATFAMLVRFAVFQKADRQSSADARASAVKTLGSRPNWLFGPTACPADVMPRELVLGAYAEQACLGGRLADCLSECEHGGRGSCYGAALEVQSAKEGEDAAEALFLRACQLGVASGCTNSAAGREKAKTGKDECSARTFQQVCDRAEDPWACTMFAGALLEEKGAKRDVARARAALGKACRYGEEDPACRAAKGMLKDLGAGP